MSKEFKEGWRQRIATLTKHRRRRYRLAHPEARVPDAQPLGRRRQDMPQQDDVKQIRTLIDDWAAGLRAKDAERVKRHGAKDLVHFSLAPPRNLQRRWCRIQPQPQSSYRNATRREAGPLVPQHTGFPQGRWRVEDHTRARVGAVPHGRQRQGRTRSQSLTAGAAALAVGCMNPALRT